VPRPRPAGSAEQRLDIKPDELRKMLTPDITPFRIVLFLTWILGIFMMNNAPAPYAPPLEDLDRYDELHARADTMTDAIRAEKHFYQAYHAMSQSKGFFYNDPTFESKNREYERTKAIYQHENAKREALRKEANQLVGIWSEYGLKAARQGFWDAYEKGKAFAKSMTWWDVIFAGFGGRGSRDESAVVLILQWVLRIAMNFTIGFFYSFVSFVFNLFWIIADFSPNPASAATFWCLGFIAAGSIVASILIAMYGTIAAVVVGGAYVAVQNQAVEGGRQGERGRLPHGHQE